MAAAATDGEQAEARRQSAALVTPLRLAMQRHPDSPPVVAVAITDAVTC